MTYDFYIYLSYAIAAIILIALTIVSLIELWQQKKKLAKLKQ